MDAQKECYFDVKIIKALKELRPEMFGITVKKDDSDKTDGNNITNPEISMSGKKNFNEAFR